jgi:hypothetical protein
MRMKAPNLATGPNKCIPLMGNLRAYLKIS